MKLLRKVILFFKNKITSELRYRKRLKELKKQDPFIY